MSYLGSWKIDDYLTFCCNTHDPDTGVATDADSVPTYRVYEDETATPILTGSMAKLDDANTTGFYSERIQLTAANGFEKGKCYTIYIAATVDSDAGTMHHNFQMEAEVDANTVSGAVAWNAAWDAEVQSECADALTAYDPPTKAEMDTAHALLATVAKQDVIDGIVDDILVDTAVIGALGAGLTAVPWNSTWDAEVQSECADALTAYDPPTKTEMDTGHGLLATEAKQDTIDGLIDTLVARLTAARAGYLDELAAANIPADVDTIKAYLDTEIAAILAAVDTEVAAIKAVTDALPDAGALSDLAAILTDTGTTLPATLATIAGYIDAEVAAILADTGELQADWANGGRLDLLIDAVKAKTDLLPSGVPKNVALSNFCFLMVLSSDHVTPATGKTITEEISKDGGAFAACTNAASEIGNGLYKIDLTQTEMNADIIILKFTETDCDQRTVVLLTST